MNDFCNRLKQLRITRGVLQKELAYYLHVSSGTISNYENGVHSPDPNTLQRLAEYYGVSTDYLLGLTDCPCPIDTINQVIYGEYTVGQFLKLLTCLPAKDKNHLAWLLSKLER